MLRNFKGAIFDMDETLGDSLMIWDILWEKFGLKFLNHKGFRPFEEDEKIVRTKTLKDAMEHIHSKYNIKMYNKNFIYLCLIFGLHLTRIYKGCWNLLKGERV